MYEALHSSNEGQNEPGSLLKSGLRTASLCDCILVGSSLIKWFTDPRSLFSLEITHLNRTFLHHISHSVSHQIISLTLDVKCWRVKMSVDSLETCSFLCSSAHISHFKQSLFTIQLPVHYILQGAEPLQQHIVAHAGSLRRSVASGPPAVGRSLRAALEGACVALGPESHESSHDEHVQHH